MREQKNRRWRGWPFIISFFAGATNYLFIAYFIRPHLHLAEGWEILVGSFFYVPTVLTMYVSIKHWWLK